MSLLTILMDYVFGLGDGYELGSLVGRLIFGFQSQMYLLLVHDDEQEWSTSQIPTQQKEKDVTPDMLTLLVWEWDERVISFGKSSQMCVRDANCQQYTFDLQDYTM